MVCPTSPSLLNLHECGQRKVASECSGSGFSRQDSSTVGPVCTLLRLLVLGLEFLVLQGQINGILEDVSQQTAVVIICGHSLLLPHPLPCLEYLCADSEAPVGPATWHQRKACPWFPLTCSKWHVRARAACTYRSYRTTRSCSAMSRSACRAST